MPTNHAPDPDAPATRGALAHLAHEVDSLRRAVRTLAALPGRVAQLETTLTQAVDDLAGAGRRPEPTRPVSWLAHSRDLGETARRLAELAHWVAEVYLRYPVAARELPDCWLWHPDVVEELAWLHQAWQLAYGEDTGSITAAADWHDRYRPGVAARIKTAVRMCSLENHTGDRRPTGLTDIPSVGSVETIAHWWTELRHQQPPLPTPADLEAAARRLERRR